MHPTVMTVPVTQESVAKRASTSRSFSSCLRRSGMESAAGTLAKRFADQLAERLGRVLRHRLDQAGHLLTGEVVDRPTGLF